jgi:uncharacterized Zn finger protein
MPYDDYAGYGYYGFKPYVPVGVRRARARRELAKLQKKGRTISPVVIDGRKIARTFWGEAWCDNLERYSDYANRLPRGRTYVRNGSVVHLGIEPGRVAALVSGSSLYDVTITVEPVGKTRWGAICRDCSGAIDSLVELLQGRFSEGVMARLCQEATGLFPSPREIGFTCSCPDWASMCKHVAAVLYGVGARLDRQPELLFTLRKVDHGDLIAKAGSGLTKTRKGPAATKVLASEDLSEMFGIEMAPATAPGTGTTKATRGRRPKAARPKTPSTQVPATKPAASTQAGATSPAASTKPAPARQAAKTRLSPAMRRAVSERMRKYWAARRELPKKNAARK